MADIKKLYIEFINDFDPYVDISEHKNLSISGMLYNLKYILKDIECLIDFSDYSGDSINLYNRCNTLIDIFESIVVKPGEV